MKWTALPFDHTAIGYIFPLQAEVDLQAWLFFFFQTLDHECTHHRLHRQRQWLTLYV